MIKRLVIIVASAIVLIFLVIFVQNAMKPRPFQWMETYSSYDKQPYGGFVFFSQLKDVFPGKKIKRFGTNDFEQYYWFIESDMDYSEEIAEDTVEDSFYLYDMGFDSTWSISFNAIILDSYFFTSDLNSKALLMHCYQGNEALIAAADYPEFLKNQLGIELAFDTLSYIDSLVLEDAFEISMASQPAIKYQTHGPHSYLSSVPDSAEIIASNKLGQVLAAEVKVGKGKMLLCTVPILFSNYYLLKENPAIAENLLLRLPNKDTYWGSRIIGERQYEDKGSLLSFIHEQEALTWAFYTLIISVLLLLLFQMKRRQRPIPVINLPQNDSLNFVELIGNLYLLNKDNRALLERKMTYFREMVRSRYQVNVQQEDENSLKQLATKSKVRIEIIQKLFRDYGILMNQENLHNADLLNFNKLIQHFKRKNK